LRSCSCPSRRTPAITRTARATSFCALDAIGGQIVPPASYRLPQFGGRIEESRRRTSSQAGTARRRALRHKPHLGLTPPAPRRCRRWRETWT
jgi:hypothetical protein